MVLRDSLKKEGFLHQESKGLSWLAKEEVTAVLAFFLPMVVYLLTLAPTIYNLDSAELTTAAATGGIIRATGYPLYLILGGLWSQLPLGDVGYRMNLMSAVAGAITLLLTERILYRLKVSGWARLAAIGLLGAAPYFWTLSLIAEVYTLHTALMAGVILALLAWREQPTPWRLALAVGLTAISLGNHMATVLLAPGCVLFVLIVAKGDVLRPRTFIPALIALLLGLSLYLYLPWRYGANPIFNYAGTYNAAGVFEPVNLQTWDGLWWLISGKAFAGQMGGYTLAAFGRLNRPDLLLLMVPRHPQRFREVRALIEERGLTLCRRSENSLPVSETRVWLGDSMGEMPAYFTVADVALIGGTLLPFGGQNLIEAAACDCPAMVGPHSFNFSQATDDAIACVAAMRIADADDAANKVLRLLNDRAALQAMRDAAAEIGRAHV